MRMNIIKMAFGLTEAVQRFIARARRFYYAVALSRHDCPQCHGKIEMTAEGRCRCAVCRYVVDPTVEFQRCSACGGKPTLRVRRYVCSRCGQCINSQFLFDGLVFDAAYFRQKMTESRQRKKEQRERVRQMLAGSRSASLVLPESDWNAASGLMAALNGMTAEALEAHTSSSKAGFDLSRYETHIQAHLGPISISMDEIPPLSENPRIDRVWRFITIIFLAHAGILDVWQEGESIMVIKHEANREGQGIPGDVEDVDRIEGSLCRVEA